MATKPTQKSKSGKFTKNESSTPNPISESNQEVRLNLSPALSTGSVSGTWQDIDMEQKDQSTVNPTAPSLFNLNVNNDATDRGSNPNGGVSMLRSLFGIRSNEISGREIESSKTSNFLAKGSWGQITFNTNTGVEYKRVPGTDPDARDERTELSQRRNSEEEEDQRRAYSQASGLLSKVQHENDDIQRRQVHESVRDNENSIQRRNLFQFTPISHNGANLRAASQGALSPISNTKIYPQGVDSSFTHARSFDIKAYEQFCRIVSGRNRRPFEGEMHGGVIYPISDYVIVRQRFSREPDRAILEDSTEEIVYKGNCCGCSIA